MKGLLDFRPTMCFAPVGDKIVSDWHPDCCVTNGRDNGEAHNSNIITVCHYLVYFLYSIRAMHTSYRYTKHGPDYEPSQPRFEEPWQE